MLPEREADGLGAEEAAERIAHVPGYDRLVDGDQSAGRAARDRRRMDFPRTGASRMNLGDSDLSPDEVGCELP